jgi:hypothetical protein
MPARATCGYQLQKAATVAASVILKLRVKTAQGACTAADR